MVWYGNVQWDWKRSGSSFIGISAMAGSRRNFLYLSASGEEYIVNADEGNIEAANNITNERDYTGDPLANFLPRNIKPRYSYWQNANGTRTLKIPILTQTRFSELAGAVDVPEIDDPFVVASTVTLRLVRLQGEKIAFPSATNTGLVET